MISQQFIHLIYIHPHTSLQTCVTHDVFLLGPRFE